MRTFLRRAAAVLVGLSIAATALEAAAQMAPDRAPLHVAAPDSWTDPATRESSSSPAYGVLGAGLVGLAVADVSLGVYEGVLAAHGQRPSTGVGIAEAVVFSPQAIVLGAAQAVFAGSLPDREREIAGLGLVPVSALTYATLVHAVASEKLPTGRTGVLYGVSWAAGVDLALTLPALGSASDHRLFARSLGVMELALTAPQIGVASYGLVKDGRNAAGWASLAGCSGALFVHGLFSVALPHREPPPDEPSPPPSTPPPPAPPKRPLLVPDSIDLGPAQVQGGAGIGVSGRWG